MASRHALPLALLALLTACGPNIAKTEPSSAQPTTADDNARRSAYDSARATLENDKRQEEATAAAIRNMLREEQLQIIATAIQLYYADHLSLPQVSDGMLTAAGSPLVGRYLVKAVIAGPKLGEVFCYGYAQDGKTGFVSGWLEIEERPASFALVPMPTAETDRIRSGLQTGETTYSCPTIAGYTVRTF